VNEAEKRGLHVALLPTWGRWVNNPQRPADVVFDEAKAEAYGRFIGKRYASHPIIWVLGGDRRTDGVENGVARHGARHRHRHERARGLRRVLMTFPPVRRVHVVDRVPRRRVARLQHAPDRARARGPTHSWSRIAADYARTPSSR
jgi:hypothetical protein